MVKRINESSDIPFKIIFKQVLTNADDIQELMLEVNNNQNCAGLLTWMHTFSPAKMWIAGENRYKNLCFICIPRLIVISHGTILIWTL